MRKITLILSLGLAASCATADKFKESLGGACKTDADCVGGTVCSDGACAIKTVNEYMPPEDTRPTIAEIIASRTELSAAGALLGANMDLAMQLSGADEFTVFVPNNEAVAALVNLVGTTGLADSDVAVKLFSFHIVPGTVLSTDISEPTPKATALAPSGSDPVQIELRPYADTLLVNGQSQIVVADIIAKNGVVHIVDGVLWHSDVTDPTSAYPGTVEQFLGNYPVFSSFAAALGASGPTAAIAALPLPGSSGVTVFASYNDAWEGAEIDEDTLNYNVIPQAYLASSTLGLFKTMQTADGRYFAIAATDGAITGMSNFDNSTNIVHSDFLTLNGVVHTTDSIFLPPTTTLYDALAATGMTTWRGVIDRSDFYQGVLAGTGTGPNCTVEEPCTAFVPSNDALAKAPSGLYAAMDSGASSDLGYMQMATALLDSAALVQAGTFTLWDGWDVKISAPTGVGVLLNGSTMVTEADLVCSNGVLHRTDSPLWYYGDNFNGTAEQFLQMYPQLSQFLTEAHAMAATGTTGQTDVLAALIGTTGASSGLNPCPVDDAGCSFAVPVNGAFTTHGAYLDAHARAASLSYHVFDYTEGVSNDVFYNTFYYDTVHTHAANIHTVSDSNHATLESTAGESEANVYGANSPNAYTRTGPVYIVDAVLATGVYTIPPP